MDMLHLLHVQLTGEDADIGKLAVELQGLDIGDIELRRQVHFHALLAAVDHHGDIGGDDGADTGLHGGVDDLVHRRHVLVVDDRVDSEIGLDAMLVAGLRDLTEVLDGEMVGGMGAHVEFTDSEIDGVGTGLDSRGQ